MKHILSVLVIGFLSLATRSFAMEGSSANIFNVMDYGAKCDGATDDSAAFQAAFNAVGASMGNKGGKILIPNTGNRCMLLGNSAIYIYKNTNVEGIGYPVLKFAINTYFSPAGGGFPNGATNLSIRGLRFEGQGYGKGNAIVEEQCAVCDRENITIEDNIFDGFNITIYSAWFAADHTIKNNRFTNLVYGTYIHHPINWVISGNSFYGKIGRPIQAHDARECKITENYIEGDGVNTVIGILLATSGDFSDLTFSPVPFAIPRALPLDGPSSNVIANNTVKNTSEEGIMIEETVENAYLYGGRVAAAGDNSLTDLHAKGTVNAYTNRELWVASGTGAGQWQKITGNTGRQVTIERDWKVKPDATSTYVIGRALKNNVIANNTVQNTGADCILIYGPAFDNSITGNTCRNGGTGRDVAGIRLSATSAQGGEMNARHPVMHNVISGNTVMSPGTQSGISINFTNYGTNDFISLNNLVIGNVITGTIDGIRIDRVKNALVMGNVISYVTNGVHEYAGSDYNRLLDNFTTDYSGSIYITSGSNTVTR